MHYTLHQLKIFLQIHKHKSITKAADELCLTQPAVSIQLKKLQDQFEVPLTEVIGRQLYVTDFGEKIAEVSNRILEEADVIRTTLNEYKGLLVGKISISVVSTGKYVIPYFLTQFIKEHPEVEFTIDVTNKSKVLKSLTRNTTDFCLVSVLPTDIPLEKIELMDNKLYLIGHKEATTPSKQLSSTDLGDLPLIFREEGSATRTAMETFLTVNQVKVNKSLELVSNEAVKQAVNAGLGYSIMPLIGLRNELKSGDLKIIPTNGLPIITSWNLVYNRDKKLSPVAKAFLKHLKDTKEDIIKKHFDY